MSRRSRWPVVLFVAALLVVTPVLPASAQTEHEMAAEDCVNEESQIVEEDSPVPAENAPGWYELRSAMNICSLSMTRKDIESADADSGIQIDLTVDDLEPGVVSATGRGIDWAWAINWTTITRRNFSLLIYPQSVDPLTNALQLTNQQDPRYPLEWSLCKEGAEELDQDNPVGGGSGLGDGAIVTWDQNPQQDDDPESIRIPAVALPAVSLGQNGLAWNLRGPLFDIHVSTIRFNKTITNPPGDPTGSPQGYADEVTNDPQGYFVGDPADTDSNGEFGDWAQRSALEENPSGDHGGFPICSNLPDNLDRYVHDVDRHAGNPLPPTNMPGVLDRAPDIGGGFLPGAIAGPKFIGLHTETPVTTAVPGENTTVNVTVVNTGLRVGTRDFAMFGPSGWSFDTDPSSATIPAGLGQTIQASIRPPEDAEPGTTEEVIFSALEAENDDFLGNLTLRVNVVEKVDEDEDSGLASFLLDADAVTKQASPGDSVRYAIQIHNAREEDRGFQISLDGNGWAQLGREAVLLSGGAEGEVPVVVNVPEDASSGQVSHTVTVRPSDAADETDSVELRTTVVAPERVTPGGVTVPGFELVAVAVALGAAVLLRERRRR